MQEIKIILLPPANAQRVKINHRPSSFFPLAQLRKSKCSSECPASPSRSAGASSSALTIPLLLRLTTPSRHLSETENIFLQPPALRSHGSVPLLPPHLCLPLPGAAGSKFMCDYCEIESSFKQWHREWEGRGFRGRMAKTELEGAQTLFGTFSAGLFCYLVQMNKITHWCFKPITSLPLLRAGNLVVH